MEAASGVQRSPTHPSEEKKFYDATVTAVNPLTHTVNLLYDDNDVEKNIDLSQENWNLLDRPERSKKPREPPKPRAAPASPGGYSAPATSHCRCGHPRFKHKGRCRSVAFMSNVTGLPPDEWAEKSRNHRPAPDWIGVEAGDAKGP